ncbi:MAG: hypothetical protein DRI97_07850 [Bacteroidetes bacterium]|nr:MAG: hypothetical protein DRI97_07850 [Bacteroidota bacterium]
MTGQFTGQEASVAAMGGTFIARSGYSCAIQNQAGLGFIEQSSVSIQHARPYLLKELGISSLSGQFITGSGALGLALSTMGLRGFRQSSLWLAYGLRLHSNISAGVGIYFRNSTIPEHLVYAPGIGFSLGLQIRIEEQWQLGARLFHPAAWSTQSNLSEDQLMSIEAGLSYSFFKVAQVYSELHIKPGAYFTLCNGIEWILKPQISLRTGICSQPFIFTWGISMRFTKWVADFSFQYRAETGLSPLTSLTHAW